MGILPMPLHGRDARATAGDRFPALFSLSRVTQACGLDIAESAAETLLAMNPRFEWDRKKASANVQKRSVTFVEAMTVFRDPLAYTIQDEAHSAGERREIIIGHSMNNRLLMVGFTEREENVIRIFSARQATRKERRDYEENQKF